MAKSKSRRPKRRKAKTAAKRTKKSSGAKARTKSRKKSSKTKQKKRTKPAKPKTKRAVVKKRKRSTAEGMRRALKLKRVAEEREHEQNPVTQPNWAPQIPLPAEPHAVTQNLREQGDSANTFQDLTYRRGS